jgi:CHAT domain-containing protein
MRLHWKKNGNEKETMLETSEVVESILIDFAHRMKDDPEGFIATWEKFFEKVSDSAKVQIFSEIGLILFEHSIFALALTSWFYALKYYAKLGDKGGEANCYANIGYAHIKLAQYREALKSLEKALVMSRDISHDIRAESSWYVNIGTAYFHLGQYQKSIEYQEKALEIKIKIHDKYGEANCYANIGVDYCNLGQYHKGIEYQEKALKIAKDIGDKRRQSYCYVNLGMIYGSLGHYSDAIQFQEKALPVFQELDDKQGELNCYANIGYAYYNLGQYPDAIKYLNKGLKIAKDIGDISGLTRVYRIFALIYQRNNPDTAYEYLRESINLSESMSAMLVEEVDKIEFQSLHSNDYKLIVPICLKLKKDGREKLAFQYLEQSKSRALIDLMSASNSVLPTVPMTNELKSLIDKENDHIARLRQIQTQHLRNEKVIVEPGEVDRQREELNGIYLKIKEYDKQYVSLRKPTPIPLGEVQAKLGASGRNAAMIEYFITQEKTFIFVVSQKGLRVKEVELTREKLIQCFRNYQREVVDYSEYRDIGDFSLQELSKYLVEPISQYLSNVNLLYFVPHDILHYISLHALPLNGEPIITRIPVAYAPSASLMQYFRPKKRHLGNSASFGVVLNEDEQIFGEEAEIVSRLLNYQYFQNATKQTVLSNLSSKDILHFSCHGFFDTADPLSSGIIFPSNKYKKEEKMLEYDILTAREIFNLKDRMNAGLVTLSACQTGLSERSLGDELVGLTRSLLYAGAASIVVSLWSVAAHSTMELMEEFYRGLKEGKDKAAALQQAMIKIMKKQEYSHPYFWAPFILIGDWE